MGPMVCETCFFFLMQRDLMIDESITNMDCLSNPSNKNGNSKTIQYDVPIPFKWFN